ncbi:SH3 domain-containing protein [Paremcibacter congregatus]|uniref:SH3b domain-containing protein n=1 Tax=Paremcibacter congregatus TaxID=2043170 RepID=A0A2G4YPE1_9PROT|nr:SH3 domain-containing protein [Paremcibacter congregatus]PHZ84183.1 hypothetical protein CRD36_13390 [Paremcibacter congregatus]QDE29084.1 hypothetical protein FIV45_18280 [Paremcibacter congregatus]
MLRRPFIFFLLVLQTCFAGGISAQAVEKQVMGKSGYLVPRFSSLAKNKVYVRTGPDSKYPVLWVYKKAGLPVKVIAEYRDWRKIVDSEGATGWVWGPLISSRRNGLIIAEQQELLEAPGYLNGKAPKVAVIAEAGVIGRILACQQGWCRLDVNGFKGWMPQGHFWGTLKGEVID